MFIKIYPCGRQVFIFSHRIERIKRMQLKVIENENSRYPCYPLAKEKLISNQ